jgi:hypothetical protein
MKTTFGLESFEVSSKMKFPPIESDLTYITFPSLYNETIGLKIPK